MRSRLSGERWRAASPELDHGLELAGEERSAWLASLRARDPGLAADVEALLEEHGVLGREGFLEGSAPARPPRASLAGLAVGAYTLLSPIGQGGMGSVWLAERSDGRFQGLVAVKLLNASLVGREGEARFRREGQILARLQHPHIARLLDAGLSTSGQPYLVLERVDGEHIDRYCDARGLGVDARLRLFLDVLDAVTHAHANLVVHRDLKPSNVLVGRDGQVKLLDFGIAKLLEAEAGTGEAIGLTREGEAALTPEYAAPEQLTGGRITTASDVYSLGVLLYLLLTGRHPLGARTGSVADLIKAAVEGQAVRASDAVAADASARRAANPRRLRSLLRGDLDNILAKALKKDPRERYVSVTALADDLKRHRHHEPVSARPDSLFYRTGKFLRRHRAGAGLAGIGAVSVLAAGAIAVAQMLEARRQRDAAVLEAKLARASSELARFVIGNESAGLQPDAIRARLDRARRLLHGSLIDDPRIRAHLLLELVSRYMELGDVKTREELIDEVRSSTEGLKDPGWNAALACVEANVDTDAGRFDEAGVEVRRGLRLLESAPATENAPWPECLLADAYRSIRIGDSHAAVARAAGAVAWLEGHGQRYTTTYADALHALAATANGAGRYREALDAILKSIDLRRQMYGDESSASYASLSGKAVILRAGGKVLEARDVLDALTARSGGAAAPPDFVLAAQGRVASSLAKYEQAIPLFERSLDQARASGREGPAFDTRVSLLEALSQAGRLDEARRVLATLEHGPGGAPLAAGPGAISLSLATARLLAARNELGAAARTVGEALGKLASREGPDDPPRREAEALAAEIAFRQGDLETACRSAASALERATQEALDRGSSAWVGEGLLLRARCELGRGDAASAGADAAAAAAQLERNLGSDHPLTRQALRVPGQATAPDR